MKTAGPAVSEKPAPDRSLQHRGRLAWHILVLVGVCVLPLAGLALYFLSTGLHREIAIADRERLGLDHVRRTVSVLQQAVKLTWTETGDDRQTVAALDEAIIALDRVQGSLATTVRLAPVTLPPGNGRAPNVSMLWQEVKAAVPGTSERTSALQKLVSALHQNIFQTTDQIGLSAGPENEISALTDVVAVGLPGYVERLLLMHERIVPDLRNHGWDAATREAATIFARQIDEEDIRRIERSANAALQSDRGSAHLMESFQRDFPGQVEALLAGLRKLAAGIRPASSNAGPVIAPELFDGSLHTAFDSALAGWNAAIDQLDALVGDQIAEAEAHRNGALALAAMVSALLIPGAWFYFRIFIRPVIQAMVDDGVAGQHAAEAARAAADESIRRLRQTQAALDDHCAVVVIDPEYRIVAANERMSRISGYGHDDLIDRPFTLLAAPDSAPYPAEFWAATSRGEVWNGSLSHQARDGRMFWMDVTVFPFRDQAGHAVEFVAIETEVTELVRAREAAEDAAKAKSQFLAMMSHEIRTPMNGVIGFAHLLADTKLDDQQRDYARTILTSGESLLVIINDVLDFSKLEAGRTELELRPVALRLLIEDVLDLLAVQARAKNLELVYSIDSDVPEGVLADGPRLRQVLLNLAGNAVKFTSAGHVEIIAAVAPPQPGRPRELAFRVCDTGIGIPPGRQDRLFKAFSQVDASVSRNYGGTGLGLAISQRLVRLMGGAIAVTSVVGKGSDFHFTLPVTEADVSGDLRDRALLAGSEIDRSLRGRRILVADDLPANQRLLERIFAQYGATTAAVSSADAALAALMRESFDLAVLDYLMPEVNGVVLAKQIRARSETRALPLILVASAPPDLAEAPPNLFETIVMKPIRNGQFAAAAARALRKGEVLPALIPPASAGAGPAFADGHPLRIMVVDDNAVNLKVIAATLRSLGYLPRTFDDAVEALAQLRSEKFDLVLMDVQMAGLDGHEATRQLRAGKVGELNRHAHVVALTAGAMEEERAACLAAGMDDFMAKPVPRAELLEKLGRTKPGIRIPAP